MRILYHLPLSPYARKARLALREKGLEFELRVENVWERRAEFLALNPAGTVPVLVEPDGAVVPDSGVICEYLDEAYPERKLLGDTLAERVEVRRLVAWFDHKFGREVSDNLYREKLLRARLGLGEPDSGAVRAGYANLGYHLDYLGWLIERRKFLAGARFSLADIAAASHLSALDYLGDVRWDEHPHAREWYARIKSRPSFRALLADRVVGAMPAPHYADLDF